MVECIDETHAPSVFGVQLGELAVFLSVALGKAVCLPIPGRAWTLTNDGSDCEVRHLGYFQRENPQEMPSRGDCRPVPLKRVVRPDFGVREIEPGSQEISLPSDIVELWAHYRSLTDETRRQFLQAGAKWQQALSHWGNENTLSFALLVVACESLKPADSAFADRNIYHVIEALLGDVVATRLKEEWFRPQEVRSAHLHVGEFRSHEFVQRLLMSSYVDPTFHNAHRELAQITQAAIIEWLRRDGSITMRAVKRNRTLRRWMKDHILFVLFLVGALGLVVGLILASFLRIQ